MFSLGPFTRAQLADKGIGAGELRSLVATGRLRRVARGWYADAYTPDLAVRAVRAGGRLGCLSACEAHGLWVPRDLDLHVVVAPGQRLPTVPPPGVIFHRVASPCPTAVTPVAESAAEVLRRHGEESGLIVLESAVNRGMLFESDARQILREVPTRSQRSEQHFSPLAQSGSETRVRLFFQRRRVEVHPQAFIPGMGYVDMLVGKSWILETDSRQHHSAPRNVAIDCDRDMHARVLGYHRDRLSFEQVWETWEQTQEFLLATLRTRRHTRPPRSFS